MMQQVNIPTVGTFEVPSDKIPELVRFLRSMKAVDITEALNSKKAPIDPNNRLILG